VELLRVRPGSVGLAVVQWDDGMRPLWSAEVARSGSAVRARVAAPGWRSPPVC